MHTWPSAVWTAYVRNDRFICRRSPIRAINRRCRAGLNGLSANRALTVRAGEGGWSMIAKAEHLESQEARP